MSLYNQLFGTNPHLGALANMLRRTSGITVPDIPRFRDMWIDEESRLVVLTRTGGANRTAYTAENAELAAAFGYQGNEDDTFDSTYACFFYAIPPDCKEAAEDIHKTQGDRGMPAFRRLLDDLKSNKDTPETRRALGIGAKIVEGVVGAGKRPGVTIIEV